MDSIFRRHRKKTILLVNLVALLLLGLTAEGVLRLAGWRPHPAYFEIVETLEVRNDYICDEKGIAKLNPDATFPEGISVNEEGFRDEGFAEQLASDRTRIMFVGDSFTYGLSASPITQCFADRIETYGYTAFNFGIPSAGPRMYAAVVEKYLPIVKPNMLAVMVFLGNDVNWLPEKLQPYVLPFHSTNVGQICAYDKNGNRMTAAEAYEYYYGGFWTRFEYYARKSVLLSLVGHRCIGLRDRLLMSRYRNKSEDVNQYAIDSFREIDAVAREHRIPCRFFIIPTKPGMRHAMNRYKNLKDIFKGLQTISEDFDEGDYSTGRDVHFNNAGHEKMARLVHDTLRQLTTK